MGALEVCTRSRVAPGSRKRRVSEKLVDLDQNETVIVDLDDIES